jgi:hypothetical protein
LASLKRLLVGRVGAAVCATVVGLVSLSLYLSTLAPGLTWAHDSADGGELATAAFTLGIAHPPGYPTYLLLAHAFTRLPIGEVATRTNLFSACCAASTTALLAWAVSGATGRWTVALVAGLALSVSPLLWSQATVTEVYALNALFTAGLLALLLRSGRRSALLALATGCVWGLSLGNHPTALCSAPMVALVLWRCRRAGWLGVLATLLSLSVYLYLPVRATADPPVNWGDPQTLDRFVWLISGALYRPFLFALPLADLPGRLLAWASVVSRQFGWIGVLPAALGAAALSDRDRALVGATGMTVLLCSLWAVGYNTTDSYLYLIPALVCLALWLGIGWNWLLEALIESVSGRSWFPSAVALLAIVLPLAIIPVRFPAQDLRADRAAYALRASVLERAPPGAVVLSQMDAHTFSLWYFVYALGQRTDVVVVDVGLSRYDWYVAQLSGRLGQPLHLSSTEEGHLVSVAEVLGRPICTISAQELTLVCRHPLRAE